MLNAFGKGINGMDRLIADVQKASERGWLKVLDRHIPVRKKHAALNTLLQGSSGILFKRWVTLLDTNCRKNQIDKVFHAPVHDELQTSVRKHHVDDYSKLTLACIRHAGEYYNFRIRLDGEVKVGKTWAQTH